MSLQKVKMKLLAIILRGYQSRLLVYLFIGGFLSLSLSTNLKGQNIVDIQHQETIPEAELAGRFFGFPIKNGIEAFKILYETLDTDGTIDTASGLMVLPLNELKDNAYPFLAYQHSTTSIRDVIPSNIAYEERLLIYYFAAQGYTTTAADYLGLGDSRRVIHPYIHSASEASAGIDLVKAAKSYLNQEDIPYTAQLFITGYSQGGHAGMAMHKVLNDTPIEGLEVTAGSHMSGIYNVSGELISGTTQEAEYLFPSYVVWMMVGYQSVYGNLYNHLSDIFQSPYTEDIEYFIDGSITARNLDTLLVEKLVANHGASIPRFLFTDSYLEAFEQDSNSPVQQALKDNDLFDWIPESPMRMMYCTADEQVSYRNAVFTDSVMNAKGAQDVLAMDVNSTANHEGCVIPATFNTALFFEQFAERSIVLSTQNLDPTLQFSISPNPATNFLQLKFSTQAAKIQDYQIRLISLAGQTVIAQAANNLENYRFSLNGLSSGLYLLQVQTEEGYWTEKVVVK